MSDPYAKNDALYQRLATGDATARDELITTNMRLVTRLVTQRLRQYPGMAHLRDDLQSEGYVALIKAVDGLAARPLQTPCHPTGYITRAINSRLSKVIHQETAREAALPTQSLTPDVAGCLVDHSFDQSHLDYCRELLDSAATDDTERRYLELLRAGHTVAETAREMAVSEATVHRIRRRLVTAAQRREASE